LNNSASWLMRLINSLFVWDLESISSIVDTRLKKIKLYESNGKAHQSLRSLFSFASIHYDPYYDYTFTPRCLNIVNKYKFFLLIGPLLSSRRFVRQVGWLGMSFAYLSVSREWTNVNRPRPLGQTLFKALPRSSFWASNRELVWLEIR